MRVAVTEFRRQLGHFLKEVQTGAGPVVVVAHGKPAAALVSMEHLEMVWLAEDEMRLGPMDVKLKVRPGAQLWMRMRQMLSRDGWTYVSDAEKAQLKREDENVAHMKTFYKDGPPAAENWLSFRAALHRKD